MKPPRRRARPVSAPPVPIANVLPLYRTMFPELGEPADSPTVTVHVSACETAVGEWLPRECTCPPHSGYPHIVATAVDGDHPVNEVAVTNFRDRD
ncbi:hypothetical protein GCM10009642_19360 [Nocardiopsis metallicus]